MKKKAMPEKTGAIQAGQFKKGQSGNPQGKPKGCKHHATRAALTLLEGQLERITQTAIDAALGGDMGAVKLILDKVLPPARERALPALELPIICTAQDLPRLTSAVLQAVSNGDLLPSEAAALAGIVAQHSKILELSELVGRLAQIEAMLQEGKK